MPDRDLYVPPSVSTEEVYRLVLNVRGDIRDLQINLRNEMEGKASKESVAALKGDVKTESEHLKERIMDLESWQTWAMRLGIPALLGVVLNLINTINGGE